METRICQITKLPVEKHLAYKADSIPEGLFNFIKKEFPELKPEHFISVDQINKCRRKYLSEIVFEEKTELSGLEEEVIRAIHNDKILSENIEPDIEETLTTGQKVADHIAEFGGSWIFIGSFFFFLLGWIMINIWIFTSRPFDPYPFILLNLLLSCIAAIQAPVIMMSQNRQEHKDRIRSEHDYQINLKAELEIKLLHEKLDHLIVHQNKHMLEIQEIQAGYLTDILDAVKQIIRKGSAQSPKDFKG